MDAEAAPAGTADDSDQLLPPGGRGDGRAALTEADLAPVRVPPQRFPHAPLHHPFLHLIILDEEAHEHE